MSASSESGLRRPPQSDAVDARCADCGGRTEADWAVCGWCGASLGTSEPAADATKRGPASFGSDEGAPSVALPSGTTLVDRYRIDAVLGRGGFGITYRAQDLRLDRAIAIKELFPLTAQRRGTAVAVAADDLEAFEAARVRFGREAAALARFNDPGIVRVFEVLEENDTAYLVMELIEGTSVGELLAARGSPLQLDEVIDVVLRVGRALGAVHGAGLLHRDINPSNIMLDASKRIVLIDFGLARRFGDDVSGALTRAVTPGYAPPEQYAGSARSSPSCDVFGLAATAYKLLTGVTPTNVFDRQSGVPLPAPIELRPDVPPLLSAGVLDGMELDPGHRPASSQAFIDRLGLHDAPVTGGVLIAVPARDETVAERSPAASAPGPVPRPQTPPSVAPSPVAVPAPRPEPFAPWHDGSPPVVGPGDRRRGWATWPVAIALVALLSASPILCGGILALVILPALATAGDLVVHRHRQRSGLQRRRWHNAGSNVVKPVRFVRNIVVGALRALPALGLALIGVTVEHAIVDDGGATVLRDLSIRVTGIAMALVLILPARESGRTFRTDLGADVWAAWAMEGRRRPGWRTAVVWVLALAAVAFAAWLDPELWPLT